MAQECAAGERSGWHEFVRDYGEIARPLLMQYFPALSADIDSHLSAVFQRAGDQQNAWFKSLKFQNEREFMMAFRELVFAYGRSVTTAPTPEVSLEQFRTLLAELNVVEREILWLFVKGYATGQVAPMMMNAEATVRQIKRVADERAERLFPGPGSQALKASAPALMQVAEAAKSEQCLSLKTFNNIINGQISWRERERAEEHIRDCFYCLDRFTAFQEMIYLRKQIQPLPDAQIEAALESIGVAYAKRKGLLAKLFARA